MATNDYAVVVGINHYPGLSDLKGAENDARAFQDWLVRKDGGNIPNSSPHLQVILSSNFPFTDDVDDALPTTLEINKALMRLIRLAEQNNGQLGRRLYLFMAGHGFAHDVDESALKMANSAFYNHYYIPGNTYAKWFRSAAYFEEVILIMDCCRDDQRRVPLVVPPWFTKSVPGAKIRHFYAFATQWSRKARERKDNNTGETRGIFTKAFIAALENAPADGKGHVTGNAVASYVYNDLPKSFPNESYPEPEFNYDHNHDIVFLKRKVPSSIPVKISFSNEDPTGRILILDSTLTPVSGPYTTTGTVSVDLVPSFYKIQRLGSGQTKDFSVVGEEEIHVIF